MPLPRSIRSLAGATAVLSPLYAGGLCDDPVRSVRSETERNQPSLSGRVIAASDVATLPDVPYAQGVVLAVLAQNWGALTRRVEVDAPPAHAQFVLEGGRSNDLVSAFAPVDREGGYGFSLVPGSYFLCVANLVGAAPWGEGDPVSVQGCLGPVPITGIPRELDILVGEAGVTEG